MKSKLFGRMVKCGERSKCDVCGKEVSFSDYIYLCKECRDKLPTILQNNHHIFIKFPSIRKKILTDGIKNPQDYESEQNEHKGLFYVR
jgi:methionyl-tRNA synthetase